MVDAGYTVFETDPDVTRWATAALNAVKHIDTSERRHGRTWFVGVDALPNDADGAIGDVPLRGAWRDDLPKHPAFDIWHRAQVSIVYPNYPQQDADEPDAAHRFRQNRDAAHVDGLLPEGPQKQRHLREPHAFIVGLPLNNVAASPLVVWPGSHKLVQRAFQKAFHGIDPSDWGDHDVTEAYKSIRKQVFETCPRVEVPMRAGQAVLLDRHLVHGVAPWGVKTSTDPRIIAYFRPLVRNTADWL